jgi:hypothetical protein
MISESDLGSFYHDIDLFSVYVFFTSKVHHSTSAVLVIPIAWESPGNTGCFAER